MDQRHRMKMKESARRDSVNSEETCSSQETTSTNISENYCIVLGGNDVNVEENTCNNTICTDASFSLEDFEEADLTGLSQNMSSLKQTNEQGSIKSNRNAAKTMFPNEGELTQPNTADFQQTVGRNDFFSMPCTSQFCRAGHQRTRCDLNGFSLELAPLLEKESSPLQDNYSQASKDTSGYEIQFCRSGTYPEELNEADNCQNITSMQPTKIYDNLAGDLQSMKCISAELRSMYRKAKFAFLTLLIINIVMICAVTAVASVIITVGPKPPDLPTPAPPNGEAASFSYDICFNCTDLEFDPNFTIETLRGIYRKETGCCFTSITSVYLSLKQLFQIQIERKVNKLNHTLAFLQDNLSISVNGESRNYSTEYIVRRMLQQNAPREKTAIHLVSAKGSTVQEENMSGVFYKLRWNRNADRAIITGNVGVHRNGLNVQVEMEGYYFIYTRLHIQRKQGYRDVTVRYSINRQRGSTSTYIHESTEGCKSGESSMEHNAVVEMVIHLCKYDVIFVSVSSSDTEYLSTDSGAHMFGLFEL